MRTERGFFHGKLVSQSGSRRIIEAHAPDKDIKYFIEIDTSLLKNDETFIVKYSVDEGVTWQEKESKDKLIGILSWEESVETIELQDLVKSTVEKSESPGMDIDELEYKNALPEYHYMTEAVKFSNQNPDDAKINFSFGSPNIGWKAHLNVLPEDTTTVSEYLRNNNYAHKYLSGGNGTEGKAFTIYFGARSVLDKWSTVISTDLNEQLLGPTAEDEVVTSMGVAARFTSVDTESGKESAFAQYGKHGMCARKKYILDLAKQRGGMDKIHSGEDSLAIAEDSFDTLSQRYGSYFHG